jgi:chromosomal replication initiator protein
MYFCKRLTRRSFPDIGQRFGGRDHTTVMHAVKRIEELAIKDAAFAAELTEIGRKIAE